jgi:inositol hexakisphosphate/diphosphoinositol-pentakisphosphate kinase
MKKAKSYDSSKITNVYDCIKYDMIHHPLLINSSKIQLFKKIQAFNSIITPLEYGITKKDKISIGYNIAKYFIKP